MSLRNELDYFFGAIRYFTRLPVPRWVGHSSGALQHSLGYFPAVGLIVGGFGALIFATCAPFWPKTLAVLASMAGTLYITGIFHEDGWSDMADGFGGGRDTQQILTIMKDSSIGSFGAIALTMILLAKFLLLLEIDPRLIPAALLGGHGLSRLCATVVLHTLGYVRDEGKAKPLSTPIAPRELAFATLTGLAPLALLPNERWLAGALFSALTTVGLIRLFKRRLGGYTGDCLGATQQLSEAAFYAGLLCRFS